MFFGKIVWEFPFFVVIIASELIEQLILHDFVFYL